MEKIIEFLLFVFTFLTVGILCFMFINFLWAFCDEMFAFKLWLTSLCITMFLAFINDIL